MEGFVHENYSHCNHALGCFLVSFCPKYGREPEMMYEACIRISVVFPVPTPKAPKNLITNVGNTASRGCNGSYRDPTGINLIAAAIGMPRNPNITLANHCCHVRGLVLAKVPRNSTMMTWNITVQLNTATKT